jgi:acetolactate synthase-1/2/3 large subunit
MKLSDYVADFLVKEKVKHAFGITGGTIVHILDSIGRNPNIDYVCNHHEQACAMAADAYSRISDNLGVALTTSGPGATNLLTGVCCSYFDSTPTLFITGQVPTSQLRGKSKARQVGFQETEVVKTFAPNTKYSVLLKSPEDIRYELEKAVYLARNGRPGPVLVDIPDDYQRTEINPEELRAYHPRRKNANLADLENKIERTIGLLQKAERPVIILGGGIRLSRTYKSARRMIEQMQVPFALTWATLDFFPDDYPLSSREFGVTANRAGNFAVQNADFILALGTRLDTHLTGSNLKNFAREAKKVIVDVDKSELEKYEERGLLGVEALINNDLNDFFKCFMQRIPEIKLKNICPWISRIQKWRAQYPICPESYFEKENLVNPYVFMDRLSAKTSQGDIIIPEAGCNVTWGMQGFKVKENQRLFTAFNHSPMGYGIPATIGASFARRNARTIGIIGDGGLLMNEQDLATIVHHNLPVKLFVLNNNGYGMIKQTQEIWLEGRYHASTPASFYIPDVTGLARAHGFKNIGKIGNHAELDSEIEKMLNCYGPCFCDVKIDPNSRIFPKLTFGKPIEDAEPLLDRNEFLKNMIVKAIS